MTEIKLNEAVHLTDLRLPAGVEIYALSHGGDPNRAVASVHIQKVIEEEVPVVAAEAETPEAAAAAAAAAEGSTAKTDDKAKD